MTISELGGYRTGRFKNSGSLAMFAAMRLASSRVSIPAVKPPRR